MFKRFTILYIGFIILYKLSCFSQNIIPNSSFEKLDSCPAIYTSGWMGMHFLKNWNCPNWQRIGDNADLYHCCDWPNICEGTEPYTIPPRTGRGFVGMFIFYPDSSVVDFSEYIQVKLYHPLEIGKTYKISLFAYLHPHNYGVSYMNYIVTNSLSAYLSNIELNENKWLLSDYIPQVNFDTYISEHWSWQHLTGSFIAQGGEQYLIIGRFIPREQVNYYELPHEYDYIGGRCSYIMIDDVAVWEEGTPVYTANAGGNKYICQAGQERSPVVLGTHNIEQYLYWWYDSAGNLIDTTAQITVMPDTTTWYRLVVKDFKYEQSSDTVWVYVTDCNSPLFVPNIFSPNGDGQNDVLYVRGQGISQLHFVVYNRWGQQVFESRDINHGWDGTFQGQKAEIGVYGYFVSGVVEDGKLVSKRGTVTLVR